MPDTWTLVTPTGNYTLNRTFHAPRYQPGGVDTNAALRREARTAYQRTGDGLPTPGPLVLRGRVWNDARDIAALVDELEAIQEAAATCIQVVRTTDAGRYVYDDLAGGPPPEVTPDGLGGWEVTLELWPGRALPTFVPPGFTNEWQHYRQSSSTGAWSDSVTDDLLSIFATTTPQGESAGNEQMLSWEGLRAAKAGRADFDALVRVRCASFPATGILFPGVALFVRLPAAPFNPAADSAHILRRHGATLELHYGGYQFDAPTYAFSGSMIVGNWYWMRLQSSRSGSNETIRGKMWADGDPEPDWQVQKTSSVANPDTPALGGTIGVGNSGAGSTTLTPLRVYEWNYAADLTM